MSSKRSGFTLIELLIVIAVMGILLAIAVPAYNDQVRKTRRAQAKADVQEIAQIMERFYTVNNTYTGYVLPAALGNSPRDGQVYYTITLTGRTASTYVVNAAPQADQTADRCGTLTLTQTGAKAPTTAGCWN